MEILSDTKLYATKSQPFLIIFQENSATKHSALSGLMAIMNARAPAAAAMCTKGMLQTLSF